MRCSDAISLVIFLIIASITFIRKLFKYSIINKLKSELEVMLTAIIIDIYSSDINIYSSEMSNSENSGLPEELLVVIE